MISVYPISVNGFSVAIVPDKACIVRILCCCLLLSLLCFRLLRVFVLRTFSVTYVFLLCLVPINKINSFFNSCTIIEAHTRRWYNVTKKALDLVISFISIQR